MSGGGLSSARAHRGGDTAHRQNPGTGAQWKDEKKGRVGFPPKVGKKRIEGREPLWQGQQELWRTGQCGAPCPLTLLSPDLPARALQSQHMQALVLVF